MASRAGWIVVVLSILMTFGIVHEQAARQRERDQFPRMGRPYDVGGRSLNLYCSGEGTPAVIFESDALTPGYSWTYIQRQVAARTRACWYDRAGYGWSDPAPAPHTSHDSARDLHALLQAAGVAPPYLLVASGFGGYDARVFAGLYRGEVSGVVLADAPHEDELKRFPEEQGMAGKIPFHLGFPPDFLIRAESATGLMRLTVRRNGQEFRAAGFSPQEQATLWGLQRQPHMRAAFLAEQGFSTAPEEVRAAGGPGNVSLVVLFGDRPVNHAQSIARREVRLELQQQLARSSPRGRLEVVQTRTRAGLQYERPEKIVEAVRELAGR